MAAEPEQKLGQSQRIRRLNEELHALCRRRAFGETLEALARGEQDKAVDGRSYAIAVARRVR